MQQVIRHKSWLPVYDDNNNSSSSSNNKSPIEHSSLLSHKKAVVSGSHFEEHLPKGDAGNTTSMVSENAIIVFARRGCCMGHVVERLLLALGANPPVYEIDEGDESRVLQELERFVINTNKAGTDDGNDAKVQFPAVFVGGRLFGGLDRLMATHISGELVPILKEAGALWL